MKIYWTQKDIPELAQLPSKVRRQNYRDAFYLAGTHIEFWLGIGAYGVSSLLLFWLFDYVVPELNGLPRNAIRTVLVISVGILIWKQFAIYVMRKYYRHILLRNA